MPSCLMRSLWPAFLTTDAIRSALMVGLPLMTLMPFRAAIGLMPRACPYSMASRTLAGRSR